MINSPASDAALGEIEKVHAVLSTARRLTTEGRSVDLGAVDARVRTLCETVDGLPKSQSRALSPALSALLGEFDSLSQELSDQFSGLPSLGDLSSAKDVAAVYGSAAKHFP